MVLLGALRSSQFTDSLLQVNWKSSGMQVPFLYELD